MIELRLLGNIELRAADGRALSAVLAQPKRLALLVYLTIAGPPGAFFRRDTLLALLWPELDEEHARAALRNSLYFLRQSLGTDVIRRRGDDEVGVDPAVLDCDVVRFETTRDVAAYPADLMPGFLVSAAPDFNDWLDNRRAALQRTAQAAAWAAVEAPNLSTAERITRAHRAAALSDASDATLQKLLAVHAAAQDYAGATRALEQFRRRMLSELELEPSADSLAMVDQLRPAAPPPSRLAKHYATLITTHGWNIRHRRFAIAAAVLLLFVTAAAAVWAVRGSIAPGTVLAVTTIHNFAGDDSDLERILAELLATTLAQNSDVQVISTARLYELTGDAPAGDPAAIAAAARKAGATEYVEGAIYRLADGQLRLDLRRVSARDGGVTASISVSGPDVFAVAAQTHELVSSRTADRRTTRLTGGTHSLAALQHYERGLRAMYHDDDPAAALPHFEAALAADSQFAMAAYHAFVASGRYEFLDRAARLSVYTTERDRLLIAARKAAADNDPRSIVIADSLATRYPAEPDGHVALGLAYIYAGAFERGVRVLERALDAEGTDRPAARAQCRACAAYAAVVEAYLLMDSAQAALRTANRWVAYRPTAHALDGRAAVLEVLGRYDEALADRSRQHVHTVYREIFPAILAIHRGQLSDAQRVLMPRLHVADAATRNEARWYAIIALRHRGRLHEATRLAADGSAISRGIVAFEAGRHGEAARIWEDIAAEALQQQPATFAARNRIWNLTHAAAAYAAAGDTARLATIAEEQRMLGPRSAYGRDRVLHHHTRGLLLAARGDHEAAIQEFARSLWSPTGSYNRTPIELARSALTIRKPGLAVAALQPAFRSASLQSVALYATRTELHEMLAHAWHMRGRPDSAAIHYRYVADAWADADPQFHPRRDTALARLHRMVP